MDKLHKFVYVTADGALYLDIDLTSEDNMPEVGEVLGKYELVDEGKYEATFVSTKAKKG